MATIKTKATIVWEKLQQATKRFVVLQGAAQSSKTISIAQHIILKCVNEWAGQKKIITIARKTFPALRASVMRDFLNILESLKLYSAENHNKTTHEYILHGNLIEFVAVDQPQKVRGRKRNICWLNEANEFEHDDFFQFNVRTSEQVFMDYNPSDEFHWIYEKILTRDDCDFIQVSMKDNPFMPQHIREELERLKDEDENLYRIYALGERGKAQDLIYPNWDVVDEIPPVCEHYRYGLDFGFNHPTALILVGVRERDIYLQEIIYQTHLTNQDLIDLMRENGVSKSVLIRADSAEPDRIEEIQNAGYYIEGAKKGKDAVKNRIDAIQRCKIHIAKKSVNIQKEIKNYRWKRDKKTDEILDEPVKFKDDAMDAIGYAIGDLIADKELFQAGRQLKNIKDTSHLFAGGRGGY